MMRKLALLLVICFGALAHAATISNISVSVATGNTATITWTTNSPSTSQVIYGLNGATNLATLTNQTLVTNHSVTVTGLVAGQVYTYAVVSTDTGGSTTSSTNTFQLCSGGTGYTNVTGTVGVAYAQGLLAATWVNDSGVVTSAPTICGVAFPTTITSSLTTSGNLSLQLPDNNSIVPSPGRWAINIANSTGNVGLFTVTTSITGNSIGLTSQLQAAASGHLQLLYYDPVTQQFDPPIAPSSTPAPTQSLTLKPTTTIGFGSQTFGVQSPTQSIVITNSGTLGVNITGATFSGSTDFTSTNLHGCDGVLVPTQVCLLPIVFTPSSSGTQVSGSVLLNTDIPVNPLKPLTVAFTGTGTAVTTSPLVVSATDTGAGVVRSSEAVPKINCTIAPPAAPAGLCSTNYPNGTPVTLTATAASGNTFQSFNGASCSVSPCTFVMASPGFTVTADISANSPIQAPSVAVSPLPSIDFGHVQNNTPSPAENINISNTSSTLNLTVNSVVSSDPHFTSSNIHICDGIILPQATCSVSAIFTPTGAAPVTGSFTINTNAPPSTIGGSSAVVVALTGAGTAVPNFALTVNASSTMTGAGVITSDEATPLINCHLVAGQNPSGPCSGNYASGATPVLTATPDPNMTFTSVSGSGVTCSTNPCTVTVSAAGTVTYVFTAPTPTFVANVAGVGQGSGVFTSDVNDNTGAPINCTSFGGNLTGKCFGTFNQGTVVTFTEAPSNSGVGTCLGGACNFAGWAGVTGCANLTTCVATMNADINLSGSFAQAAAGSPLALVQKVLGGTPGTNNVVGNFASAQSAGNTIILYGLWNDNTTTVSGSITDSSGNTYTQSACSPKTVSGQTTVLYYAANVAAAGAGVNSVTMNLTASPSYRRILALEYSGLTATPVDVCAGASGTTQAINSGNLTTNFAGDLLTGGTIAGTITAVSPNFTQQIYNSGNDVEDRQGVAIGTYNLAPTQAAVNNWATILAAWKVTGTGGSTQYTFNTGCGGTGSGTVTASGINMTCTNGVPGTTGTSTTVAANSTETLVANPLSGSVFVAYSGGGCSTQVTCTTSAITTNTTVTATFNLNTAQAQNYYVNPSTGSNSNSGLCAVAGTPAGCTGPWQTIAKAESAFVLGASGTCVPGTGWIAVPNAGVCIHVATGAYSGPINTSRSGTPTRKVVFISDTRNGAVITNPDWNLYGDYSAVYGFEMTSPTHTYAIQFDAGIGREVQFNYIHDIHTSASCSDPRNGVIHDTTVPSSFDVVNGNVMRHMGPQCTTNGFHAIYVDAAGAKITNNIVSGLAGGWAIQKQYAHGTDCTPGTISNNTLFNNSGGIIINDEGSPCAFRNWEVNNNIIVNNGVAGTGGGGYAGIAFWTFAGNGTTLMSNNMVYGNLPNNFMLHGNACTPSASNLQCPETNNKTENSTAVTFVNFRSDTNLNPDASYNAQNYKCKAGSQCISGGTQQLAPGGFSPSAPTGDIGLPGPVVNRPAGPALDLGVFEQ